MKGEKDYFFLPCNAELGVLESEYPTEGSTYEYITNDGWPATWRQCVPCAGMLNCLNYKGYSSIKEKQTSYSDVDTAFWDAYFEGGCVDVDDGYNLCLERSVNGGAHTMTVIMMIVGMWTVSTMIM